MTGLPTDRSVGKAADDRGLLTAELAVGLLLVFLPLVLFLTAVFQWPERQAAASLAASEGARAAALADNATDARAAMERQVRTSIAASGISGADVVASIDGEFEPGKHIFVTVAVRLPTIAAPGLPPLTSRTHRVTIAERVEFHRTVST